jgi:hypothetical protein
MDTFCGLCGCDFDPDDDRHQLVWTWCGVCDRGYCDTCTRDEHRALLERWDWGTYPGSPVEYRICPDCQSWE